MIYLLFGTSILLLDQFSKYLALSKITISEKYSFNEYFFLSNVQNHGFAFSIFDDNLLWQQNFILFISSIVLIGLAIWFFKDGFKNKLLAFSISAMFFGGLGNLIDRIRLDYVIDFIGLKIFTFSEDKTNFFFIFNVADIFITIGILTILTINIFEKEQT